MLNVIYLLNLIAHSFFILSHYIHCNSLIIIWCNICNQSILQVRIIKKREILGVTLHSKKSEVEATRVCAFAVVHVL